MRIPNSLQKPLACLAALAPLAVPAGAAIHQVDCVEGPFLDIGTAVEAAGAGDTVLVHACPLGAYQPFTIDGADSVHVLGARSADGDFRPGVAVDGRGAFQCILVDASVGVTIQGFDIRGCGFHALEVRSSTDVAVLDNRFLGGVETIRDQASSGSRYMGNLLVGGVFSLFLDSQSSFVASNRIVRDLGSPINILGPGHHVVGNEIRDSGASAIVDQGTGSRIERNRCTEVGNGDVAGIVLNIGSVDADVVGNLCEGGVLNLGNGSDLADNL